jgi:hypothetical protein
MAESDGFPGWMAPIIGPIGCFVFFAYEFSDEHYTSQVRILGLATGVGIGFVAGLIVWRSDARKRKEQEAEQQEQEKQQKRQERQKRQK